MDKQIYDLLGYGSLTPEIVDYLMGLWAESSEFKTWNACVDCSKDWSISTCVGAMGNLLMHQINLPQNKKRQLREQLPERENHLGLRQVDVYTGLNVMILLLELHRYAQRRDELKDKIAFYPCGQPDTEKLDSERLLRIIGYGHCLGAFAFNKT